VVLVNQSLLWVVSQFHRFPEPLAREEELGRGRRRTREGDDVLGEEGGDPVDWRDYLGIAGRSTLLVVDEAHEFEHPSPLIHVYKHIDRLPIRPQPTGTCIKAL